MLDKLRSLAGLCAVAGLVSIVLSLVGYNLRILMWIDLWGETVGWLIRAGLVVGGAAVFFVLPGSESTEAEAGASGQS